MNDRRSSYDEYKIRLIGLLLLHSAPIQQISGAHTEIMANRKGVFIGAYVPNELKESLRRRAALEHRTLSQEITRILIEAVHGKGLPTGSVDRRTVNTSVPRRRATDPPDRRRADDLPYIPPSGSKK